MSVNNFDPTAANILSSLRIRGASAKGGADKEGFVPVLGPGGTLDASVIPFEDIQTQIHIPTLGKTAYVDRDSSAVEPDGSIASPFKTLTAAAASSAGFSSFILASGSYGAENVVFTATDNGLIRVFTTGSATFAGLSFSGYNAGVTFWLDNVSATTLDFKTDVERQLILTGRGQIGSIINSENEPYQPITVFLDPDFAVGDAGPVSSVVYLAKSSRIENSSVNVPGETVSNAIDSLGSRLIRIPVFSTASAGISVSEEDIPVEFADSDASGGSSDSAPDNMYVLTRIGTTLAEAVNGTFHKDGDSPSYAEVAVTGGVTANSVSASEITANSVNFKAGDVVKGILSVNNDGFLVVNS